jgi:hypothetical protein
MATMTSSMMAARKTGESPRRTYSLSVADLKAIEALRVRLGLKSDAAVIRRLIRDAAKAKLV